jgi:phage terminase small subunit
MSQLPAPLSPTDGSGDLSEREASELWHSLTDLQQRWTRAYVQNGFNATEAARTAGYQASSDEAFQKIGYQNRHHDKISRLLTAMMEAAMPEAEALARLADMARASMEDVLDFSGDGPPVLDLNKARRRGALSNVKELDLEQTRDPDTGEVTTTASITMYNKRKALEVVLDFHGAEGEESADVYVEQLNQQVNNHLKGEDSPFSDVDNTI